MNTRTHHATLLTLTGTLGCLLLANARDRRRREWRARVGATWSHAAVETGSDALAPPSFDDEMRVYRATTEADSAAAQRAPGTPAPAAAPPVAEEPHAPAPVARANGLLVDDALRFEALLASVVDTPATPPVTVAEPSQESEPEAVPGVAEEARGEAEPAPPASHEPPAAPVRPHAVAAAAKAAIVAEPAPEAIDELERIATAEPMPPVTAEPERTVTAEPMPAVTAEPERTVTAEPMPPLTAEPERVVADGELVPVAGSLAVQDGPVPLPVVAVAEPVEPASPPVVAVVEPEPAAAALPVAADETQIHQALLARGLSDTLARRLITQARAHQLPFAPAGQLRDAVRDELARALPDYHGLPTSGALVALVGPGGSGKTRVAAALAAAYHAHSALTARAIATGEPQDHSTLTTLLAAHGIPVSAPTTTPEPRDGQLVVIDTAAITPADPTAITNLADTLQHHATDAILITLPATTSHTAATQLLTALAPLHPTAIVITHADETDQIGNAIETAITTATPLAYIHEPHNPSHQLRPAHPTHIAAHLLP